MSRRFGRRALLAIASCLLAISILSTTAHAEYGEVQRIGSKATGAANGQLTAERTRLLGVDPSKAPASNSIYVLDEPVKFTQAEEPAIDPETKTCEINETTEKCVMVGVGPLTRHFRIQKLALEKEKYAFAGSVLFDESAPEPEALSSGTFSGGVEGIAVDPELKRIYVLAADNRQRHIGVDAKVTNGTGVLAASTLYAFSTKGEPEGKEGKLMPAAGAGEHGVLTSALEAQSKMPGKALLQPTGIAVDPKTHDVIVLGHVDESGSEVDNTAAPGDHYALQRIKSDGTLGARYVDKTDFFKHAYIETPNRPPDSPIVVSVGAGAERVYVNFQGLVEVPEDFTSSTAPHTVAPQLIPPFFDHSIAGVGTAVGPMPSLSKELAALTGGGSTPGGVLSAAPEGTIYGQAEIRTEEPGVNNDRRDGVLAFNSDGSERGWTGGQTPLLKEGEEVPCAAQPALEFATEQPLRIAAGDEGKVFVLNPEFLKRKEWERAEEPWTKEEEEEEEVENSGPPQATPSPHYPPIVEFGEGGKGCPRTRATPPEARAAGKQLTEAQSVPLGSPVAFSSELAQGDALKVEWEWESTEGVKETQIVTTDRWTQTNVTHTFEHEGTFKVKETIHTNDLATPVVTVEAPEKVHVSEAAVVQPVVLGPATAPVSQTVTFSTPAVLGITSYKWSFGDGSKAETTTPKATHAFAAAGTYKVELVVANAKGKQSAAGTRTITITPPGEPPVEPPTGGGGGGGAGSTSTGTSTPTVANAGGAGGGGGVLSYRVSVPSTTLAVSPSGTFSIKVDCLGQSSCTGTVTLRTLTAVSAVSRRKAVLTLASGSFKVAAGHVATVSLRLSAKAKALLRRVRVLRAKVTIAGRDSSGAAHTSQATATLRLSKTKHH
jgi:PKD repeat protein